MTTTKKEKDIFDTLEVCYEKVSRGYRMTNIDLNRSLATEFLVDPEDHRKPARARSGACTHRARGHPTPAVRIGCLCRRTAPPALQPAGS